MFRPMSCDPARARGRPLGRRGQSVGLPWSGTGRGRQTDRYQTLSSGITSLETRRCYWWGRGKEEWPLWQYWDCCWAVGWRPPCRDCPCWALSAPSRGRTPRWALGWAWRDTGLRWSCPWPRHTSWHLCSVHTNFKSSAINAVASRSLLQIFRSFIISFLQWQVSGPEMYRACYDLHLFRDYGGKWHQKCQQRRGMCGQWSLSSVQCPVSSGHPS